MKKIKPTYILLLLMFVSTNIFSQSLIGAQNSNFTSFGIDLEKFGPYLGLQRGKFSSLEFGVEYQLKELALFKPETQAVHAGVNYDLSNNVLGYEAGYWFKKGRMNLSYGANLIFRTDYSTNALGISPVVGFKLAQFHLQTGYNYLPSAPSSMLVNRFFISLRFVFIQKWKFSLDN
jgi:hypothetical protein